ncbi:hypothetical protein GGR52DRAFT_522276 [Hypoxylon sp. FL1284]|nr:hypothetical protein GGR52DRAFT_522276 [Hypoxylon sp. FL1284]
MDGSTLQAPRTGRSRFSKALPAPPPALEDNRQQTATSNLSSAPYSLFPPGDESVSTRTNISPSMKSSSATSPLPALPSSGNSMESTSSQTRTRSIPRKPVGLPANPTPAAAAKAKKLKRVSSISSILSAYSNTSSDSVQRSSQGSSFTKDSEPSNSPQQEGMSDAQQSIIKSLPVLPSNPYEDELFLRTDEKVKDDLPPPLPIKDVTRPTTPQSVRPLNPALASQGGAHDGGDSAADSPTLVSPQRREIWRRRASSKSDRILVPELKLAGSHGSTAATAQPTDNNNNTTTNPESLPLPPPPQPVSNSNSATTSPLPPRNGSLPGRNIRPNRQAEPQGESNMRKFTSKLKEITGRGEEEKEKDADGRKDKSDELSPPPPMKDRPSAETSTIASKTSAETVVFTPADAPGPASSAGAPEKESAEKSISRRPVGAPGSAQPDVQSGKPSGMRKPSMGLPRFPRPSQSNNSLRTPSAPYTVQETVKPKAPPIVTPPVVMPTISLSTDSDEPTKKPELFNLVTALNEPRVSPDSTTQRSAPARKVSKDIDATALSDIGESTEHMTAEQTQQVNEALSRFPRQALQAAQAAPPADSVWQAAPVSSKHYNCFARHVRWVPVKNMNYPLNCQACGVQDTSARKTCSFCSLRICFKCHERLMGPYKADVGALMRNMAADLQKEKGKQKDTA